MSEPKIVWIRCQVSEGAFSQENNIQILLSDGRTISFFADKGLLKVDHGHNYVRATLVGSTKDPHVKTVLLPVEPFETGSRWISVPDHELVSA
jgi:hypothetical protein